MRTEGERRRHWDDVYRTKRPEEVSWFEADPATSMRLLTGASPRPRSVVDVGAGASRLVDELIAGGVEDVTALDVSEEALAALRRRLPDAPDVRCVVADVTTWEPDRTWEAWHDRAVFHFLVDPADRSAYAATAARAVAPGGIAVLGTFAPDGPERCSGLPTARYDADALAAELGDRFQLERSEREEHVTPSGAVQPFTWVVLRRR